MFKKLILRLFVRFFITNLLKQFLIEGWVFGAIKLFTF